MGFKKKGYTIIRNAISADTANIFFGYVLTRRNVCIYYQKKKIPDIAYDYIGKFGDAITHESYNIYGDPLMETLLVHLKKKIKNTIKDKHLYEAFAHVRAYKKGDALKRHTDRGTCSIAASINLGGDPWPLYVKVNKKEIEVNLKPGDMLVYPGRKIPHWRNVFKGDICIQAFLMYTDKKKYLYDTRSVLGLNVLERKLAVV